MATKLKSVETVEEVLTKHDEQRMHNLRLWQQLGKTDPAHTKQFQRAGGFRGTAIKPIWVTQRLTELFGPAGFGWGTEEPKFETVIGQDGEVLVYCTVAGWYIDPHTPPDEFLSDKRFVFGVGGDKAVSFVGRGNDRRMVADDEAFKKAFTDAVGNAFKFVGVGADVHMGLFDDSKYVQAVQAEFHPPAEPKVAAKEREGDWAPTTLKAGVKALVHSLNGCGCLADFKDLMDLPETKEVIEQCERRFPAWWETGEGLPPEFKPLKFIIAETKQGLAELEPAE